jgi:hypothetical protein
MGLRDPAVTTDRYDSEALHTFLLTWIYQGRRLPDLECPTLAGGLGVLDLGLRAAIPHDPADEMHPVVCENAADWATRRRDSRT